MALPVRVLTSEEAARYFPKRLDVPQAEYLDAVRGVKVGDFAAIPRGEVSNRAFKRRLTLAAKHLNVALRYAKDAGDDIVRFEVRERGTSRSGSSGANAGASNAPRKRGRPPKNRTAA